MQDKGINVAQGSRRQTQLQRFHKTKDRHTVRASDFKGEHAAITPCPQKPPGQIVLWMVRQTGVVDARNLGMAGQPLGDLQGVGALLSHAQG